MPRKSPYAINLSPKERQELCARSRKYTSSYFQVIRAKIILLAAAGLENKEIGRKLAVPRQIVSKWRKRFFENRMAGLEDYPRHGRPCRFSPSNNDGSKSARL